ncbi:putative platelet-activating factor acetylhydrolase [Colletotrichum karsti]|uniref:Putative phospholipase n=1 Tax=Colletotrichum karsti TaxID=1095194 RepID=A0A9P6I2E8_9PEZI|nr:putative platelet-activating factor acetylhydrolase [Colletotrichum karsti]KAF9874999.1 putative platelet-activating factor acetylhydrolase [Colletotrichum karsti]
MSPHAQAPATAAEKVASFFSRLSPVPAFPDYTGPHKVGTVDIEVPVSELESPSPTPYSASEIYTVQCRVFYPAVPESNGKRINWLPSPQRQHVSAYTQFIGIRPMVADMISFFPRHLHYTTIPVHKNAEILEPDTLNRRWPTMIFSHGLGGNRNTYSAVAGSLASHGVVVICPEHRDGSAVASFVRIPDKQDQYFVRNTRRAIPYIRLDHEARPEIYEAREDQLRIRLWELGLIHVVTVNLDLGMAMTNLNKSTPSLTQFKNKLHVHEPGCIIFGGHSFGSASVVQFLKTTYYAESSALAHVPKPLFTPRRDSALCNQITEKNVTMLLDMWCFPLLAPGSSALFDLPLPAYANKPAAPGGHAILAVESDAFFKWKDHLHVTARVLSPAPSTQLITPSVFRRSGVRLPEPNFFYVENSAHLSQSDFGVLFPWLTKKIFNSEEPERALRLNLRAQLQLLRANDVPVARTWIGDLVDGTGSGKLGIAGDEDADNGPDDGLTDDKAIFDRGGGKVRYWKAIDVIGMGSAEEAPATSTTTDATAATTPGEGGVNAQVAGVEQTDRDMEEELEPLQAVASAAQRQAQTATVRT